MSSILAGMLCLIQVWSTNLMGLETANNIGELVESNPVAGDGVNQGDDHIRLIKTLLKQELPVPTKGVVGGASGQLLTSNGNNGMGLSTYNQSTIADHASRIAALEATPSPSGSSVAASIAVFTLAAATDTPQNMTATETYDPDNIVQTSRIIFPTGYRICRITPMEVSGQTLGNNHSVTYDYNIGLSSTPDSFSGLPSYTVPAFGPIADTRPAGVPVVIYDASGEAFYLTAEHSLSGSITGATGAADLSVTLLIEMLR